MRNLFIYLFAAAQIIDAMNVMNRLAFTIIVMIFFG